LYLIMCLICRFIVKKKSAKKYLPEASERRASAGRGPARRSGATQPSRTVALVAEDCVCVGPPLLRTPGQGRAHMRRMGQNTGMLKRLKKVMQKATQKAFVSPYLPVHRAPSDTSRRAARAAARPRQNLNSGSLRTKGRNSSSLDVGSVGPSVSGSVAGERKPISRFSA